MPKAEIRPGRHYEPSKPVDFRLVSTYSPKHGAAIGESLGSEALAGYIQGEHGSNVNVGHVDLQLDPDIRQLGINIIQQPPDILGISVKIGALEQVDSLVNNIQSSTEPAERPLIVLGGVVPTFASQEILRRYPACVIAVNEGEKAASALVEVVRGEKRIDQVPGLLYIDSNGNSHFNTPVSFDLNKRRLPARLTTERIHKEHHGMIWAEASRGCNGNCTFCSVHQLHGSGFKGEMSTGSVIEDLRHLKHLGISTVSFTDDDFCGDPERAAEIARLMIDSNLGMQFSISTRADHIWNEGLYGKELKDPEKRKQHNARLIEIMSDLRDAGLTRVFLGMESGSPTQLKRYGKRISVEGNYKAINLLRSLGIDVVAGYIPIDHLMTMQELLENVQFLKRTGMYRKITNPLSVLRVQAGSPYLKLAQKEGLVDGPTEDLVFYNAHFKNPAVEKVAEIANQWVQDMYPFIFGLKGEVAQSTLGRDNNGQQRHNPAEQMLYKFRDLEMRFISTLTYALVRNPKADTTAILRNFIEKRERLIAQSRTLSEDGMLGNTSKRLIFALDQLTV